LINVLGEEDRKISGGEAGNVKGPGSAHKQS